MTWHQAIPAEERKVYEQGISQSITTVQSWAKLYST